MKSHTEVITLFPAQSQITHPRWHIVLKTLFALIFFAGNSILCRWAMREDVIDASSFSAVRLLSAAVTLVIIFAFRHRQVTSIFVTNRIEHWLGAGLLFLYAVCFSFAYMKIEAGLGALILFSCVQLTMLIYTFSREGGLSIRQWLGLVVAMVGLGYLLSPSAMRPDLQGVLLMATAGVAWAGYTLLGKRSNIAASLLTTKQFVLTLIFIVPFFVLNVPMMMVTKEGLFLAIASGSITSGVGYLLWNSVLPHLKALTAGVVQLLVPVIAMILGALSLAEWPTLHSVLASIVIMLGVGLIVFAQSRTR